MIGLGLPNQRKNEGKKGQHQLRLPHSSCNWRASYVATRQTKNEKETPKVKNPNPMLQLIQHHITLLHRDAFSRGNDRIGSSDLLDSGGWVPRSLHVHHQCTGGQRIPGITMTACMDILTKAVTSNPQSTQPKCPNQICDSHPDLTE